jgi:AcrR family transcriptional regulator
VRHASQHAQDRRHALLVLHGYESTTVREIASAAGADPALVIRYFGNKEELFVRATQFELRLPDLSAMKADNEGEVLVRHFFEIWEKGPSATSMAILIRSVFDEYHRRYPRIRIRVLDEASSDVLLAVTRGDADFGVTSIGTQEADIDFQPLIEEAFVLACPRAHPLGKRKTVAWKDLGELSYIALAHGSGNRFLIDQALARSPTRPRWFCQVNHVPALVSLVTAGLGVGVVPRMALPPDGHHGLVAVPLVEPKVSRTLGLISRRGRPLPAAAQLLYDMLVARRTTSKRKALPVRR